MRTSEFLTIAGAIVPDRPAVIFDDAAVTFEEVQVRVNRLANAMAGRGVKAGDRVAIMQVNSLQGIELYFAAAQLDAIYVPINFRAKTEELEQMLREGAYGVLSKSGDDASRRFQSASIDELLSRNTRTIEVQQGTGFRGMNVSKAQFSIGGHLTGEGEVGKLDIDADDFWERVMPGY